MPPPRRGPVPPVPELVGFYLTELATSTRRRADLSGASIEWRLSGIVWGCTQRGHRLDRQDRHVAAVLAEIRRRHIRPPRQEAVSADDISAMIAICACIPRRSVAPPLRTIFTTACGLRPGNPLPPPMRPTVR